MFYSECRKAKFFIFILSLIRHSTVHKVGVWKVTERYFRFFFCHFNSIEAHWLCLDVQMNITLQTSQCFLLLLLCSPIIPSPFFPASIIGFFLLLESTPTFVLTVTGGSEEGAMATGDVVCVYAVWHAKQQSHVSRFLFFSSCEHLIKLSVTVVSCH